MRLTVRRPRLAASCLVVAAALAACSTPSHEPTPSSPRGDSASVAPSGTSEAPAPDLDEPTSWGPTEAEIADARELVADWTPEQLAGQVIVGRYFSTDPAEAASLVKDLHLAGMCVTSANVTDEAQVRATTQAISDAAAADGRDFPAVVGVDEEGGSVAHLRGIATTFPAFQVAGMAVERDRADGGRAGRKAVLGAARASGLELRDLGFTWVFAPVADVTIGAADPTIGTRSAGMDPRTAATATAAAVRGYDDAGIVSTAKHFPGHGSATADSHLVMPRLTKSLAELRAHDLLPFKTAIRAGAPSIMLSHLDVEALAPGVPASMAPEVYDFLREDMGFDGLAITDSMGMGAVATRRLPGVAALQAGADLLLMPADTRGTHATVTRAIADGTIPRERIEDAAATVVAVQLWQQRTADEVPVPADATSRAERASAALSAAAY
ncbi:glycoside hydrolase family 3 N-terminal domain-containing protein [Nocardioides sp. LHG3406-4]|uniref:glycoside hydrolase family 3 N-terminal domain-containing protein n=1 Tax=Nocardioides sp. LHG3406-4 TaxID=2804575 RepID=UPI003CEC0098